VVSVDTHPLVRLGVAEIAERCPDLRLVGQAATGEEARELVARTRPDVVVIGDTLPAGGRALAAELRAAQPALGLVSLSGQTDPAALRRGREAGLSALVARSARIPVVAAAIRHAATEPGALRGFGTPVDPGTGPAPVLSRREEQVLALIGDGLSNEDIAATLRVGRGTVRTYVTRLLAKLHARSRSQAVVAARSLPVGAG
jgi:DNA-binding NarL/FixJ family response regulator